MKSVAGVPLRRPAWFFDTTQQGRRWPTTLSREDFRRVTAESDFPDYLTAYTRNGQLDYFCNTAVSYRLRGIQVRLNLLWEYESAAGSGDTHLAVFRGTRARIEVRQGKEQNCRPELYVAPNDAAERDGVAETRGRSERGLPRPRRRERGRMAAGHGPGLLPRRP